MLGKLIPLVNASEPLMLFEQLEERIVLDGAVDDVSSHADLFSTQTLEHDDGNYNSVDDLSEDVTHTGSIQGTPSLEVQSGTEWLQDGTWHYWEQDGNVAGGQNGYRFDSWQDGSVSMHVVYWDTNHNGYDYDLQRDQSWIYMAIQWDASLNGYDYRATSAGTFQYSANQWSNGLGYAYASDHTGNWNYYVIMAGNDTGDVVHYDSDSSGFWDYTYTWANGYTYHISGGEPHNGLLIKEIGTTFSGSVPKFLTNVNGVLYFSSHDDIHGTELWKSDGTALGTILVADINPGSTGSDPANLTSVNGILYFSATDGTHGTELWKSDGTPEGTVMVADLGSGATSSSPGWLTDVNGTLYFSAGHTSGATVLWTTDGTAGGTIAVVNSEAEPEQFKFVGQPSWLTDVNGTLYLSAADEGPKDFWHGVELWKCVGTTAHMVKDLFLGTTDSYPHHLVNVNGTLFFGAEGVLGDELYKSDGTEDGTVLVKDINVDPLYWCGPTTADSNPHELTNVNGTLFFVATDGARGFELWESDGTADGTILVKDIFPGFFGSNPHELTNVDGTLYFSATDGVKGYELWKSEASQLSDDPTTPDNDESRNTVMVMDINSLPVPPDYPAEYTLSSYPHHLTNVNGTLYFVANDGIYGDELWKCSSGAVSLVKDIFSNVPGSNPNYLTDVNGTLYFSANDGSHGYELWTSDGTTAGTAMVKDIDLVNIYQYTLGSWPQYVTNVNGILYFIADDGIHGKELWRSDGTATGTYMVKDLLPGNESSFGYSDPLLTDVNGTLYFVADDAGEQNSVRRNQLWKSDGTEAGTVKLTDVGIRHAGLWNISGLTNVNGTLFFSADDWSNGQGLWKTDGTPEGTVIVTDAVAYPSHLINMNGTLFFSATDGTTHGYELWKTDGTAAGTVMIADINPGTASSIYSYSSNRFTNVNGTLFFSATDGTHGDELWKTDGTAAGTVMVADIRSGSGSSFSSYGSDYLTNVNGTLYFSGDDGTHGRELWKSDGTQSGTVMVQDINTGSGSSDPRELTNVNGTLYFSGDDGTHGRELWKSDGTDSGTVLVSDINPGNEGGMPYSNYYLTNVNGTLYFAAYEETHGTELWKSDGTASGTVMVRDIKPSQYWSSYENQWVGYSGNPSYLTVVDGTLYFSAFGWSGQPGLWMVS